MLFKLLERKRTSIQIMCVILIFTCITGVCFANDSQYEDNPLAAFTFHEVFYTYDSQGEQTSSFVYNDGLFLNDATEMSPEMAKMGIALAAAAYDRNTIKNLLESEEMNFVVEDNSASYDRVNNLLTIYNNDYVAYTIAHKIITYQEKDYIVYCVPVKGTGGNAEWYSNFNLGDGVEHEGFSNAARTVYMDLCTHLVSDEYDKTQTIVFFTGHSRGAAVANLLAGWLTKEDIIGNDGFAFTNHIFAYTFACPAISREANTLLTNIYNFNNPGDMIPLLPLEKWGYDRHGISYEFMPDVIMDDISQQFQRLARSS